MTLTQEEAIKWLVEQSLTQSDSISQISMSLCKMGLRDSAGEPEELIWASQLERLEALDALATEHRAATRAAFGLPPVPAPPNSSGQ